MRKKFIEEDKTLERLKAKGFDADAKMQADPELLSDLEYKTTRGLESAIETLSDGISFTGIVFGIHPNPEKMDDYCAAEEYLRRIFDIAPRYTMNFLEKAEIKPPLMKALALVRILGDVGDEADCDIAYQTIRNCFEQVDIGTISDRDKDVYLLNQGLSKDIKRPQTEELRKYLAQRYTQSTAKPSKK